MKSGVYKQVKEKKIFICYFQNMGNFAYLKRFYFYQSKVFGGEYQSNIFPL